MKTSLLSQWCLWLACFFLGPTSKAQILINEICSDNESILQDNNGVFSDWIEIYNPGLSPVNLPKYFISDDTDDPQKWAFPDIEIGPLSYLVLFANGDPSTPDNLYLPFKIAKEGEHLIISDILNQEIDYILIPGLQTDQAYGRAEDGSAEWAVFSTPSPGSGNQPGTGTLFSHPPEISPEAYFYDSPVSINLSSPDPDAAIYYSLDGTLPTEASLLYDNLIIIDTTTLIRAISISPGRLPSPELIRTVLVDASHELAVVSLCTEPHYLWDWENGIFQDGPDAEPEFPFWGANYWKEIQIPVHIEFFEPTGDIGMSSWFDAEVHGGRAARTKSMKPLRLTARKKYGPSTIDYPFFNDRENTRFRRLLLRNASGDYNNGHIRDPFLHRYFMKESLDLDVVAYRPTVVYINGVYWGVMNLREKIDRYYLAENYGADPLNLDLLEEDTIVIVGGYDHFNATYDFITSHNMAVGSNFATAGDLMDLSSLADYFIVQTAVNNTNSINANIKYWRENTLDSKWRYILFDLDVGLAKSAWSKADVDTFGDKMTVYQDSNRHVNMLRALLENESYQNYFLNRYADLLNSTFRSENFLEELDWTVDMIDSEMPAHFDRWGWPGYEVWKTDRLPVIERFMEDRPDYARDYLEDYFKLDGQFELTVAVYPPGAGTIVLNTLTLEDFPWDGVYFKGVPVSLKVIPNPGFEFSHWDALYAWKGPMEGDEFQLTFLGDDEVVAWFGPPAGNTNLHVLGNPAFETAHVQFVSEGSQEIEVRLFAVDGRLVWQKAKSWVAAGVQEIDIDISGLSPGTYMIQLVANGTTETVKVLVQ